MKAGFLLALFFTTALLGNPSDFDLLMGKETPSWEYLQTPEDHRRLDFFRTLYNKNFSAKSNSAPLIAKIPKTFHLIWLGPDHFPEQSLEKVEKWIALHPDWTSKFWTDLDRKSPHPKMEKQLIGEFPFEFLKNEFYDSVNFGEKAKILAFEILFKEGGVYIDHDTFPCKPLTELHPALDFYCGLEKLGPTILSSSVMPATHLIGAKQGHPILKETMIWLRDHWTELEQFYPGQTVPEVTSRVLHRTFSALSEGIERGIDLDENKDVVFPVSYFSGTHRKTTSFAIHSHEAKWTHISNRFEKRVNRQFNEIIQKNDEAILLTLTLAGTSFLVCVFLFFYARRVNRRKS